MMPAAIPAEASSLLGLHSTMFCNVEVNELLANFNLILPTAWLMNHFKWALTFYWFEKSLPLPVANVACHIISLTNNKGLDKLPHCGLRSKRFKFSQKDFCRTLFSFVSTFYQVQIIRTDFHNMSETAPCFSAWSAWDVKLALNIEEHWFTFVIIELFHFRDTAIWMSKKKKRFIR